MSKDKMKQKIPHYNANKGITLIALIITIVVMLILVVVTLMIALGENGVVSNAKIAKKEYNDAAFLESIQNIALGYYDSVNGGYDFIQMEAAILAEYPDVSIFYSSRENDSSDYLPMGAAGSPTVEFLLPLAVQNGKTNLIACTVTKGDVTVTIGNDIITKGDITNNGDWISQEEAQKLYQIEGGDNYALDANLVLYKGNETNVKIPYQIIKENGTIYGFDTIDSGAFKSIIAEKVMLREFLAEIYVGMYEEDGVTIGLNEITVGQMLDKDGVGGIDDSDRALKIMTTVEDEKERVLSVITGIYFAPMGVTENDYDIENGDIYIYMYEGAITSKFAVNRQIESVIIPKSIRTIYYQAFANNTKLEEVTIKLDEIDRYTSISSDIFEGCTNLKSIKFPNLTKEQVMTNFSDYTNAWGAGTGVEIICSDGAI